MENNEHDKKGSTWVPGFEVMGQGIVGAKHEPMSQDTFLAHDGSVQECSRAVQTERCNNMLTSRPLFSRSNMTSMDASTKELLSSLSASPVTLSGLYCTGMEASVKDIPPSIRTHPTMLSGLYGSEGVGKDCSAIAASNSSTVVPGILSSHVHEIKIPGFNSTTCHTQRPWIPQKPQNYQLKNVEKESCSQTSVRVARPPGEGRGKNQLLPRYWPRITDQELQLLTTKDSNSTIVPLFEKVLSASDAGKIGRLVLPKACAEAYFPPISQAEGLPITVQDISGKDWTFQFRFWPNNNSRMYVLEGITPCIQSMQLQAGDTVIFSRRDPEGKLVMGYRRASNISSVEETQKMVIVGSTSVAPSSHILPRSSDKLSTVAGVTGLLSQSIKSSSKAQLQRNSGQIPNLQVADPGYGLLKAGTAGSKITKEDPPYNLTISSEKRKAKEIGSKHKKARCDADSQEFKINWEEAQSLLRSPPNVIPSIVTIEGYDFEEYEDPPVFGKEAIPIGSLPRKFCNTQQVGLKNTLEFSPQLVKAAKKQVLVEPLKESEALSGLETLANLAAAEENMNAASSSSPATIKAAATASSPATAAAVSSLATTNAPSSSSPATTTKHPRHRPGCSCIVCIQPPSGKGPKHKPNCDCNVCMTVKRRFHTLMLRRKKLQSEREAESSSQKNQHSVKEVAESVGARRPNETSSHKNGSWHGSHIAPLSKAVPRVVDNFSNGNGRPYGVSSAGSYASGVVKFEHDLQVASKGPQIDLNSQPEKEEETNRSPLGFSMKSLLLSASYPLDMYLKQHGLTSLVCNDQLQCSLENVVGNAIVKKDDELEENRIAAVVGSDGDSLVVSAHIQQ